jgi:hypothetical protein
MRKLQTAALGVLVSTFIGSAALAQHSHPTLTGIFCNSENVGLEGDSEFVRFVDQDYHVVLTFGKSSGGDDCFYVGGRVDANGFPATSWAINMSQMSESILFLTKVRKSGGQIVWFKTNSVDFNGHVVSFHGALNGLTRGDTFVAIYAVDNGAPVTDTIVAVEVDGMIGTNNIRGNGNTNDATEDCAFVSHAGGCQQAGGDDTTANSDMYESFAP